MRWAGGSCSRNVFSMCVTGLLARTSCADRGPGALWDGARITLHLPGRHTPLLLHPDPFHQDRVGQRAIPTRLRTLYEARDGQVRRYTAGQGAPLSQCGVRRLLTDRQGEDDGSLFSAFIFDSKIPGISRQVSWEAIREIVEIYHVRQ